VHRGERQEEEAKEMGSVRARALHVSLAGDWKQVTIDGQVKWLIAFMDDSSRLITCYGIFDSPTTENTLLVLRMGFAQYGVPRKILTDHGTQFVSARDRDNASHTFKEFLDSYGIKHIVARIKHPQTNGKIERFF